MPRSLLIALCLAGACARSRRVASHADNCGGRPVDTTALVRLAVDTIGRLRAAPQRLERVVSSPSRVVVWTEDTNSQALHDGGRVGFSCDGYIRLVWLDGG